MCFFCRKNRSIPGFPLPCLIGEQSIKKPLECFLAFPDFPPNCECHHSKRGCSWPSSMEIESSRIGFVANKQIQKAGTNTIWIERYRTACHWGHHNPNCLLEYFLAIHNFWEEPCIVGWISGDLSNYAQTEMLTRVLSESSQSSELNSRVKTISIWGVWKLVN